MIKLSSIPIIYKIYSYCKKHFNFIIFIIGILILVYGILILFDWMGPTSIYDKKFFGMKEEITINEKPAGSFNYLGAYQSKGVISVNKEVEFYIYEVQYYLEKEPFKDSGISPKWPDNITIEFCPDNVRVSGDKDWQKSFCTIVRAEKSYEDSTSIYYYKNSSIIFMKKLEFLSSGLKGMQISVRGIPIGSMHMDNEFEIEPYSTDLQIQLQKFGYVLSLLGIIVVVFQIYEFGIKLCSPEKISLQTSAWNLCSEHEVEQDENPLADQPKEKGKIQ